jgi:hypothetical protein
MDPCLYVTGSLEDLFSREQIASPLLKFNINDLRPPPKHSKRCQPFFLSGLTMASLPSDGFSQGTRDGHEWQLLPVDPCEGAQICCSLPQGTQLNTIKCKGTKAELALMYNCLTKQSQGELE